MELSNKTARELFQEIKAEPHARRFGFGRKPALVNVDLQYSYTARRIRHRLRNRPAADRAMSTRSRGCSAPSTVRWSGLTSPIWTRAKIAAFGARGRDTPDSLQNIKVGSRRASSTALRIDRERDIIINKRMASAFFETNLGSLFTFHKVDTVMVTGGSTSGCVRATVVDSLSRSFRTIVPEECVADKHESPHFANLYDMALKYADVLPVAEVVSFMEQYKPAN